MRIGHDAGVGLLLLGAGLFLIGLVHVLRRRHNRK